MWEDPIVAEVHRIREELAARFDFDVTAMFADMRARQVDLGRRLVSLVETAESTAEAERGRGPGTPANGSSRVAPPAQASVGCKKGGRSMSLWVRALEFACYWLVFGTALLGVCKLMSWTSRSSNAGFLARIGGSLLLGPLGLFVGLYHVVTLGVILANNYQLLLPSFGWCIWAAGAGAATVPWLIRGPEHRPPEISNSSNP